jgi:type I restriction enzyme S subunit
VVVPTDWKEVRLGDISNVKTGPFGSALHASDYVVEGTPIITVEHLGEFRLQGENAPLVGKKDVARLSSYVLRHGDLVFSRVGSIGRFGYVEEAQDGWLFSGRLLRLRTKQAHPRFLYFQMCSTRFINQIFEVAVGQTMPSLNTVIVGNLKVALPPLKEQEAISEVLSDTDAAIEALDALIAKKRDVKQATMQQLLTGRTRLTGFSDEWMATPLATYAVFLKGNGLSRSKLSEGGEYSALLYGELFTNYNRIIRTAQSRTNSNEGVPSYFGDVLLPGSTTTTGEDLATASALLQKDVRLGGDVNIVRPNLDEVDPRWLAYRITNCHRKEIGSITQGITIHHLYGKDIASLSIPFPSLGEQKAVADVLSDMDDELEALTEQVLKLRMIKEGMMQDLLTGKVRLV